jgi:hypothetical protein
VTNWSLRGTDAMAIAAVLVDVVRGHPSAEDVLRRSARADASTWARMLALEGCGPWIDRQRTRAPVGADGLAPVTAAASGESARALRNAVAAMQQLAALASVAAEIGVRMLVLKGAARLLAGEPAGARMMADIDLLVPDDVSGARLDAALRTRLDYTPSGGLGTPPRHHPALVTPGKLPVEIHHRATDRGSALDRQLWHGTIPIPLGEASVEIPNATMRHLHTLEHAIVVHRGLRFRLRDVIDVAITAGGVDGERPDADTVARYIGSHRDRQALETLLAAASETRGAPATVLSTRAWQRVRRMATARAAIPPRAGVAAEMDPRVSIANRMAEGDLAELTRLAGRAFLAPKRAAQLVCGRWLPPESEWLLTPAH